MLHIMVVDDEAPIRDWLVYCIQKCEAASSVTSAVNGEEAYRRILEQKPNVVFTDIRMPGMDGLELMSKVRDILPFTVFIILTNYAEFSYAKQAISLGAREYILKSEMRSSDIQRIVAEIAATTAKIRSEKVHDVLQDGVVDLYEMYRNFEQPGAVAAFWQRQGLRPGQPYLAFCVANDSSLDLRRQMVALASASRAPFSAAAMVQEHLYLLLQCPEAEALRGYALDTEAALGECRLPAGVSALCTDIGQLIRVLGEAAAAQEACFFTGGGVVPYSAIHGLPPIDREDIMELSGTIDDVTDSIEDVLLRLYMFRITSLREDAVSFVSIICDCCCALKKLMVEFPEFRKSKAIKDMIIEINHLEENGDKLYTEAMRRLYSESGDAVEILSWTAIYDRLEKCCDKCEDVADVVETVILKYS